MTRTLLFVGDRGHANESAYLRAYVKATGETLWEHKLPGRQHIVIGVGGVAEPARLVAFRLRQKWESGQCLPGRGQHMWEYRT